METTYSLTVAQRTATGKQVKQIRQKGLVPGVVYGREVETLAVSVEGLTLSRIFNRAGRTGLVELSVGDAKPVHVLITDLQTDHLGRARHVDFHQVKMDEVVRTAVPLRLIGDAPAVFNLGGSLVQNLEELEVEALPAFLPQHIDIDISGLEELESHISVSDLKVPEKVTVLTDEQEQVCKVESPRSEEELAELDAEMGDTAPPEEGEALEGEAASTEPVAE